MQLVALVLVLANAPEASPYPVQAGTAEWREFETHDEMLQATELDPTSLHAMKTEEILNVALAHPLLGDALLFHRLGDGVNRLVRNAGPFQILIARPDLGAVLSARYDAMSPASAADVDGLVGQGAWAVRLAVIETLLADDRTLQGFDTKMRKNVFLRSVEVLEAKQKLPGVFGAISIEASRNLSNRLSVKTGESK